MNFNMLFLHLSSFDNSVALMEVIRRI